MGQSRTSGSVRVTVMAPVLVVDPIGPTAPLEVLGPASAA
uniref:E3 ubiquitin-protein ligase n=1 Tax=Rhizophora mucronata TaxID=61149 RepID=A0A2P2Q8S5_RHIMU